MRKAILAAGATCVCIALTGGRAAAASGDVVLYATDVTSMAGNWARVADSTAAGGQMMASANRNWSNTAGPLATPANFFDAPFSAPAATAFHVWVRLRASGNSKNNDSVYVQFSDAVDSNGAALYRIGTTSGLVVNLAGDSSGRNISGWGWRDGAYFVVQQSTIRFASSAGHTVRVQTREDGVQVDQIVLSPATYLTQAPGPASNDTTIVPKPAGTTTLPGAPASPSPASGASGVALNAALSWTATGATSYDVNFGVLNPPPLAANGLTTATYPPAAMSSATTYYWQVTARNANGATTGPVWAFTTATAVTTQGVSPTAYTAISDRNVYPKPAVPALGAAGFKFNDPTFGSRIARITDGGTRPGWLNRSFRVPSNAHLAAWNLSSTRFYVISNDGTVIPFAFDAATMTASRIQPTNAGDGGLTLAYYVEPHFSLVNPNAIYGVSNVGNLRTITQYDFSTATYTTIVDLDTIVSGLSGTYVGAFMTGGTTAENMMTFFGGASQDAHYYLMWAPMGNLGGRKLINTVASTINGRSTATLLNFHIHSASIDKGGRYVFIYPTSADLGSPRYASQVYVWDTQNDSIIALTPAMHPGGHDSAGYGYSVNQDCCTTTTWDAMQWQFRSLADPTRTNDMVSPVLSPQEIYLGDHQTWNNARPDAMVPFISSTYRYGNNTVAWRAWDDEIIALDTTGGVASVVWRFAHHRSNVGSDTDPATIYFWYEPIASVSPDGRWVLFTSNWEKTLGKDSSDPTYRQDVFLVALTPQ